MNLKWQPHTILLGTGGKDPRVEIFSADSGETRRLIDLPPGHSTYAIAINPEDGSIAVGTKGGLIHLMTGVQNEQANDRIPSQKLVQGAPILSLCWVNKFHLAVSDTADRCLLWHTNQKSQPQSLKITEGAICHLLYLANGTLAGISSNGGLHYWQPMEGQLVRVLNIPPPPPIKALVRMVYWPAEHSLALPGPGGRLTLIGLENNGFRHIEAHRGDFYAITLWGESLLTIGMKDSRMKIWPANADKPLRDLEVTERVISAGLVGISPNKLLLVEAEGTAGVYTLEEGNLRLSSLLPGKDYRAVATPPPEKIQESYARLRETEVQRIVAEIRDQMGKASDDVIEKLHSRLIELDCEAISLMLRAEQAEQKGYIVEALRSSYSLIRILPENDPRACASMEAYAALLEKAWHIPEAYAVCKRIQSIDPAYPFVLKTENISRMADLVKEEKWLIEPDASAISIEGVIKSATLIGKQFLGRYVINSLERLPCGRVILSPKAIEEKYNEILKKQGDSVLPTASTERVWWISTKGAEEVEIVTFGDGKTNSVEGLQVALKITSGDLSTVVFPVVLFDWRWIRKDQSVEEKNERALRALAGIRNKASSKFHLSAVGEVSMAAIRRLIGERRGERKWGLIQ